MQNNIQSQQVTNLVKSKRVSYLKTTIFQRTSTRCLSASTGGTEAATVQWTSWQALWKATRTPRLASTKCVCMRSMRSQKTPPAGLSWPTTPSQMTSMTSCFPTTTSDVPAE